MAGRRTGRKTRGQAVGRQRIRAVLAAGLLLALGVLAIVLQSRDGDKGSATRYPSVSAPPAAAVPVPPPPQGGGPGPLSAKDVNGRPRVAVVLDDLGMNRSATERAIRLPAGVTLAFLPYAPKVAAQARRAGARGHELLVHLPMEPVGAADPGPMALYRDLEEGEFHQRLEWNLSRFAGFVGVNNHMGSAYTADAGAMRRLMRALASRGLFFLDSRTTKRTVARPLAARIGIGLAERAIFLDHEKGEKAIRQALRRLEHRARTARAAIAIGHPHPRTLAALEAWLPGLSRRGFVLVPVSALVRRPAPVAAAGGSSGHAPARP